MILLSKEEFCQQYILNRAKVVDHFDGQAAAKEAIEVYKIIKKFVEKT